MHDGGNLSNYMCCALSKSCLLAARRTGIDFVTANIEICIVGL